MRIAIFDYKVVPTNPIGSCHLRLLKGLSREHEFVVFSAQFENPDPARIRWIKVPVPMRPLALMFVCFHILAPIWYAVYLLRARTGFDLVQVVESNSVPGGDVSYAHFCHRRFLKVHWPQVKGRGLRSFFRFWDHWLHAIFEPLIFRRAKRIVVPSRGLARELAAEYPFTTDRITVLANPVDLARMNPPADFDRAAARRAAGFADDDIVIAFVALGHFERKGLPLLVDAIAQLPKETAGKVKLKVVGGERDLIDSYRDKAAQKGLADRVVFCGMQRDVRPHLWAADAFALPSVYEVFPLVVLEAAAAGMPVIVTPLNGVEEFARDGENCILIERSVAGVRRGIERLLQMTPQQRDQLGQAARDSARQYGEEEFHARWRQVYRDYLASAQQNSERVAGRQSMFTT